MSIAAARIAAASTRSFALALGLGDAEAEGSDEVGGDTQGSTDAELVARHRTGDPTAFEAVLRLHRDAVYGYLVRCRVASGARDDVAQEIFIRVHRALGRFEPLQPMRAWIMTITANAVRSHFRRAREVLAPGPEAPELADQSDPPALDALVGREVAAWVDAALAQMPRAQREVVMLSCIEGLEQDAVAAALAMPVNTVKTHLRRGRLAVAQALARRDAILRREQDR